MAISHVARSAEYQQISDAKITGFSLKKPYNTSNLLGVVIYVIRKGVNDCHFWEVLVVMCQLVG
jgi:hypothetical protein